MHPHPASSIDSTLVQTFEGGATVAESALLRVGQAVAKQVALMWLADKKSDSRRGRDLAHLIRARFPIRRKERDVIESLIEIEDDVARQLAPGINMIAHDLAENEKEAALNAVSDALEYVDLSDQMLLTFDLDASAFAEFVRRQWPIERAALSERATRLYELCLDRACIVLMHLLREVPEFDAVAAVESLRRLRTALDGMSQLLDRVPERALSAPSGSDFDEQFRNRYLQQVARSYNQLEVVGLTTHSYEPRTTLSVAYLSLTVTDESTTNRQIAEYQTGNWLSNDFDGANAVAESQQVEHALAASRLTVIRGEAGAGKSTLLRWLAVNAARGTFTEQLKEWNNCTPFLVKLRDFSSGPLPRGDGLLTQPSSPQCGPIPQEWAHRQLESGRALLLIDGVDELSAPRRNAVRGWLRDILRGYPDIRILVTSRPTAVTSRWLTHEGFRSVILEPMTTADVRIFLHRWHAALQDSNSDMQLLPCKPEEIPAHERALLAQLQARPHLRALARNPLLCAMLCALNLDRRAKLPRDRLALYSAALEMLLERRDADRNIPADRDIHASVSEKVALLRVLAWWLNENGRIEMSHEQALARITDRLRGMPNILEDASTLFTHLIDRSGVIRQPAQGRMDFIHRTFQEFLAAQEAVDRDSIDLLIAHATSDLWRETVLMACAQASAEQRGHLLDGLLERAVRSSPRVGRQLKLLAAACKETAVLAPPETLERVDSCIRSLTPPRSIRESRSLATIGESVLDYLPSSLVGLPASQAAACVRTTALVNGPRALDILARYAEDPRSNVQEELIRAWKFFDPKIYAGRILAHAPLPQGDRGRITIDFPAAIPFLHLLRNLQRCHVNLWHQGAIVEEVRALSKLTHLTDLTLLGDTAPHTFSSIGTLENLEELFVNFATGWPKTVDFLGTLTKLHALALVNAPSEIDFKFLENLPHLVDINLIYTPVAKWMKHIVQPADVRYLACSDGQDSAAVEAIATVFNNVRALAFHPVRHQDLTPLMNMPIRSLQLYDPASVDLTGIGDHKTLRNLRILSVSMAVDLTPIANLNIGVHLSDGIEPIGTEELGPGVMLRVGGRRWKENR